MTVDEIYKAIGKSLVDYIPGKWTKAFLKITRGEKVAGYSGTYENQEGKTIDIDIWEYSLNTDLIHQLHAITTGSGQDKWNQLNFVLHADGRLETDFIWDQEHQDKLDKVNKK